VIKITQSPVIQSIIKVGFIKGKRKTRGLPAFAGVLFSK